MRVLASLTLTLAMAGGTAAAQTPTAAPGPDGWSLDVSANTYIVPDSENYLQPTVAADHDWLRLEARAVQRTKVYRSPFDIQRGFFAGFSYRRAEMAVYVFDLDASPTVVVALSVGF